MLGTIRSIIEIHRELCDKENKTVSNILSQKDKNRIKEYLAIKKRAREELLRILEKKAGVKIEF